MDRIDKFCRKDFKGFYIVEVGLKSQLKIKNANYINLSGKLSLLETAEVIKRAEIYVGIDSGPAHFANAVGTKAILLLGKWANFDFHQPYSGNYKNGINAVILRSHLPTSEIPLEDVISEIQRILNFAKNTRK